MEISHGIKENLGVEGLQWKINIGHKKRKHTKVSASLLLFIFLQYIRVHNFSRDFPSRIERLGIGWMEPQTLESRRPRCCFYWTSMV